MSTQSVSSETIETALADKHVTEFFVTQVKNGPTYISSNLLQVDAMAIYKSWSHQRIVGYEIKVSRSDFMRDAKYTAYTAYCNELYLVCPMGMIQAVELPLEIGLMWYNPTTKKIVTKRKAQFRRQEPDADMLFYLLMYRVQSDRYPFHSSKAEFFKEWLQNRDANASLGREIRGALPNEIRRLNDQIREISHLSNQRDLIREIQNTIEKHGGRCWADKDIPAAIDRLASRPYCRELDDIEQQADLIKQWVSKARVKAEESR